MEDGDACGGRVVTNAVLCTICEKWIHDRCAKIKGVTPKIAKNLFVEMRGIPRRVKPNKTMCNEVETGNEFCYLGDRLNAIGRCEAAVTASMRLDWIKFREYGELLLGRRYLLKRKNLAELRKIGIALWKRNMALKGKRIRSLAKD